MNLILAHSLIATAAINNYFIIGVCLLAFSWWAFAMLLSYKWAEKDPGFTIFAGMSLVFAVAGVSALVIGCPIAAPVGVTMFFMMIALWLASAVIKLQAATANQKLKSKEATDSKPAEATV